MADPDTFGANDRRREDRRRGDDRRAVARVGGDRRRGDRRAACGAALVGATLLLGEAPAGADVFTRRSASGVFEATNLEGGAEGWKLAFRSKGRLIHSPEFRPGTISTSRYEPFILEAAARERLDAGLLRAVIRTESAFDERAVSSAGARGLMQLMPDTAARFGVRDAFDPRQNIAGGAKYLAVLLRMFKGDVALACAGYNAGEGAVMRHRGIPPYRETRDYVRKIQGILAASGPAPAAPATGMMTFTPGGQVRESAAVRVSDAAAPRATLYRWRDAAGRTHVGETPPAGVEFAPVRSSD